MSTIKPTPVEPFGLEAQSSELERAPGARDSELVRRIESLRSATELFLERYQPLLGDQFETFVADLTYLNQLAADLMEVGYTGRVTGQNDGAL